MPVCEQSKDTNSRQLFHHLTVAFGVLLTLVLLVLVIHKWVYQMNEDMKRKLIPRMSAVIILFTFIERSMRWFQVFSLYGMSSTVSVALDIINNSISLPGIFGSMFIMLIGKLVTTFSGTVYSISDRESRVLFTLAVIDMVSVMLFFLMIGPFESSDSWVFRVIVLGLSFVSLVICIGLVSRVDYLFVSNLGSIVVRTLGRSTPARSVTDAPYLSQNMRQPTVSNFDANQQVLLKTAGRNLNNALFLTVSFLILFAASICIVFGHSCSSPSIIIAQILIGIAFGIIDTSLYLSMPFSDSLYRQLCGACDRRVQRLVSYKTSKEILKVVQFADEKTGEEGTQ